MNCKPGDIAYRKKALHDSLIPEGAFVCVVSFLGVVIDYVGNVYENCWEIEYQGKNQIDGYGIFCPDDHLVPIRDPGEDARDETLEWLPVPSKEKETA